MNFPGSLDAQEFLATYWQKQPLLLPNAVAKLEPRISPEDLAWLATQEDVESRLVFVREVDGKSEYTVEHGPFEEARLKSLPASHWSLLVHDVEKHLPEFRTWLKSVEFIPDWRIDDLMISVAAPGGSVGPHVDNYDVFLCQSSGIRNWKIEDSINTSMDENSAELALLQPFEGLQSHDLAANDVLYLPPGVAHWGVAQSLCVTCSVGMRAPSGIELELARERINNNDDESNEIPGSETEDRLYSDTDLEIDEAAPGRISHQTLARVRNQNMLHGEISDTLLAKIIGVSVTDPKVWLDPERLSASSAEQCLRTTNEQSTWRVHGMARLAWFKSHRTQLIFVNGSWLDVGDAGLDVFRELCVTREIQVKVIEENLVLWLLQSGCFDPPVSEHR